MKGHTPYGVTDLAFQCETIFVINDISARIWLLHHIFWDPGVFSSWSIIGPCVINRIAFTLVIIGAQLLKIQLFDLLVVVFYGYHTLLIISGRLHHQGIVDFAAETLTSHIQRVLLNIPISVGAITLHVGILDLIQLTTVPFLREDLPFDI